jgi:hypothetical protein
MATEALLEQRLAAVETALAEIQRRLSSGAATSNWIERFTGAFKDEPAFAEVIEYGRAARAADSPHERGESTC